MNLNLLSKDLGTGKQVTVVLLICLPLGLLLTVPAFMQGMIISDDILIYSNWHQCFFEQLSSGNWYPRWLMNMNGGLGSPVFYFYPPLPFYLSAFVGFFLPTGFPAWYPLYFSFGLTLGLSGLTTFLLLRNYAQSKIAFLFALFYMLAPYHLFVNFYHRFAYPEFCALTLSPLVFHYFFKTKETKFQINLALTLSYALILLTHIPTFIILTFFFTIFFIIKRDAYFTINVLLSSSLGILIVSFYVLPIIFYKNYVNIDTMFSDRFSLYNNFLYIGSLSDNYYLGLAFLNLMALFFILIGLRKINNKDIFYWLLSGFLSVFLLFEPSTLIWKFVPLLEKIQFPWRLNQITLIAIVILAAWSFDKYSPPSRKRHYVSKILFITLIVSQVSTVFLQISTSSYKNLPAEIVARTNNEIQGRVGVLEYLPRWSSPDLRSRLRQRQLHGSNDKIFTEPSDLFILKKWEPSKIEFETKSKQELEVTIKQLYFPLWKAEIINYRGKDLKISPKKDGLIHLLLPPGKNQVIVSLKKGIPENIGLALSFIGALIFIYEFKRNFYSRVCSKDLHGGISG